MCILFSYYRDFLGALNAYLFCLLWIYHNIIYYYSVGMEIYIHVHCTCIMKWQTYLYRWCKCSVKSTLNICINKFHTQRYGCHVWYSISACSVPHSDSSSLCVCIYWLSIIIYDTYTYVHYVNIVLAACFVWWAEPQDLILSQTRPQILTISLFWC